MCVFAVVICKAYLEKFTPTPPKVVSKKRVFQQKRWEKLKSLLYMAYFFHVVFCEGEREKKF